MRRLLYKPQQMKIKGKDSCQDVFKYNTTFHVLLYAVRYYQIKRLMIEYKFNEISLTKLTHNVNPSHFYFSNGRYLIRLQQ